MRFTRIDSFTFSLRSPSLMRRARMLFHMASSLKRELERLSEMRLA